MQDNLQNSVQSLAMDFGVPEDVVKSKPFIDGLAEIHTMMSFAEPHSHVKNAKEVAYRFYLQLHKKSSLSSSSSAPTETNASSPLLRKRYHRISPVEKVIPLKEAAESVYWFLKRKGGFQSPGRIRVACCLRRNKWDHVKEYLLNSGRIEHNERGARGSRYRAL